jgi:hypothetical protein
MPSERVPLQILANLADDRGERLSLSQLQQRIQKSPTTISTWIRIGRCAPIPDALESDRIDVGRAMALAPLARDETLPLFDRLLPDAPGMERDELVARVSALAGEARLRRPLRGRAVKRVATLTERRLMEVYRLPMNVDSIDDGAERNLLDQIQTRVHELMA